jgi:hypothetical protein
MIAPLRQSSDPTTHPFICVCVDVCVRARREANTKEQWVHDAVGVHV